MELSFNVFRDNMFIMDFNVNDVCLTAKIHAFNCKDTIHKRTSKELGERYDSQTAQAQLSIYWIVFQIRFIFSRFLKDWSDCANVTVTGRPFQTRAVTTGKRDCQWWRVVSRGRRTKVRLHGFDTMQFVGKIQRRQGSGRQALPAAMRCAAETKAKSQCSSFRSGVTWSHFLDERIDRAKVFGMDCADGEWMRKADASMFAE